MQDEALRIIREYREIIVPVAVTVGGLMARRWRIERRFRRRLERLCAEFEPNGGSSLKDKILHLAQRMQVVEQKQDTLNAHICEIANHTNEIQNQLDVEASMSRATIAMAVGENTGMFVADAAGKWTYADGTLQGWTRRGIHEMLADAWAGMLDEDDRIRVVEAWDMAVQRQMDFRSTATFVTKDDRRLHVHIAAVAMRSPRTNALVGWTGRITSAPASAPAT